MNFQSKDFLVVDTETYPDRNLPGYKEGKFNPPPYHKIIALSMAVLSTENVDGETVYTMRSLGTAKGTEKENLQVFADFLKGRNFCFVGYNSHSFDAQVLINRCLINGVDFQVESGTKFENPSNVMIRIIISIFVIADKF